jgi:hypothetical protein
MGDVPTAAAADDYRQPQPGGGWISGPAIGPLGADDRPEFSVQFFALEVIRLLAEHRIQVDPDSSRQTRCRDRRCGPLEGPGRPPGVRTAAVLTSTRPPSSIRQGDLGDEADLVRYAGGLAPVPILGPRIRQVDLAVYQRPEQE